MLPAVLLVAYVCAIDVPHVDLYADPLRSATLNKIVHELAPSWVQRAGSFSCERLGGGLTNSVIRAQPVAPGCESVLVRIYGEDTEHMIDRKHELRTLQALSKSKYFPHTGVLGTFHNGRLEKYAPGRVPTLDEMRAPAMVDKVCAALARLHLLKVPSPPRDGEAVHDAPAPSLFPTLYRWLNLALAKGAKLPLGLDEVAVRAAIDELRGRIDSLGGRPSVVFCHNDVSAGNMVVDEEGDSGAVHLIDFEYATYNYRSFDLANHLFEYAGSGPICWDRLPTAAEEADFLTQYARAFRAAAAADATDAAHVRALHAEVEAFKPATHLFWGLWALARSAGAGSDDAGTAKFDYRGYASERLALAFPAHVTARATATSTGTGTGKRVPTHAGVATHSGAHTKPTAAAVVAAKPALALRGGAKSSKDMSPPAAPAAAAALPPESTFEDYGDASKHYDVFRVDAGIAQIAAGVAAAKARLGTDALRVLDAGCGSGNFLGSLATLDGVGEVVGMEPNDGMRARAQAKAQALGGNVSVIAGSVVEPPTALSAGSFDVVVINQMIHHLDGQDAQGDADADGSPVSFPGAELALGNMAKLLRPGGLLLVNFQDAHQIEATWYYELIKPHMLEYARTRLAPRAWYAKTLGKHGYHDVAFHVVTQLYFDEAAYLDPHGPEQESWRRADSAWAGLEAAEVQAAVSKLKDMAASGELPQLIADKEQLRKLIGMSTTVAAWH